MAMNFKTTKECAEYIQKNIDFVDACFVDPLGMWHHCTYTPSQATEKDLNNGWAFDGSSIKLFTGIAKSDMMKVPDVSDAWIDPFAKYRVLHITCDVKYCDGREFLRCPRNVTKRALKFVKDSDIGDQVFFGPEPEFFIFDDVKIQTEIQKMPFEVDGEEGYWNSGVGTGPDNKNLGHRAAPKSFYFPVPPIDTSMDLRSEMLMTMKSIGIPIEKHHHEVATLQSELGFTCQELTKCADSILAYKYVVKNVAKNNKKTATFMPKPLYGDNGSGMHCHQSIWKNGTNIFWDEKGSYEYLSQAALWYMGGLIKHANAVLAFTNPTVNSYKRLVPGYEAPSYLAFSRGNRSAAIRIPLADNKNPKSKRMEFRCPDAAACPHLAFSAMLMAGLDGIINKIEPPAPLDVDIYELTEEQKKVIPSTPANLLEAVESLEKDQDFLLRGDVFDKEFLSDYVKFKKAEYHAVNLVPTPMEYKLYYHC